MKKQKKQKSAPFADLPMFLKFNVMLLLLVIAVCAIWLVTIRTVMKMQKDKYKQTESISVMAAEQILNISVETAVSIAKNIYTNEAIYDFLNTQYASASDYYATYYPLQQNTAMNLADTNIIRRCMIYTENPTVLVGGNIQKLEAAKSQYWYQCFQRMGKPTILCIDPDTAEPILVRKLDYMSLTTGESYLCLVMNNQILTQFMENLNFDGELYIISGSDLLYSSEEEVRSVEDVTITPEFECLVHNYYTVDLEFYSRAARLSFSELTYDIRWKLIGIGVILLLIILICHAMFYGIRMRIRPVIREFKGSDGIQCLQKGKNGRDELGQLLDICSEMAERIRLKGDESELNTDTLLRKSSDYDQLFKTAMWLDAELALIERLPELRLDRLTEQIPLWEEAKLLEKTAAKHGASYSSEELPKDKWVVPAYSLVLIADDVFRRFIVPSVSITLHENTAYITFESPAAPKATDILKLRAIFEDSNISTDYQFDRSYRFNPYMRLKSCLGSSADIEIMDKNMFKLILKITQQGEIS